MALEDLRHLPYRKCDSCDVRWKADDGDICWCCGDPGDPCGPVTIGSQCGAGSAYTDRQWAEVRRQVL